MTDPDKTMPSGEARPDATSPASAPTAPTAWLPADFVHPLRVELPTGEHLRPMGAADIDLDYPAVMGSRERLWTIFGNVWGWPPATMTRQQDKDDLARHEAEISAHESFLYGLFDANESALLGCVYVDPPFRTGADADISWWVVDGLVGSGTDGALTQLVPHWITTAWPFTHPRYPGTELSWDEWLDLPLPAENESEKP
jgi:hypothetical protein